MLYRLGLLLLLLLALNGALLACAPPAPPVSDSQTPDTTAAGRIQLTSMQLQAGRQTYESFVLQTSGQLHWAQWNSDGLLLAAAQGHDPTAFTELQQHPLWQSLPETPADPGVLGRPAFYAELARIQAQRTELRSLEALDTTLSELTARLQQRLRPQPLQTGLYLWLTPQSISPDLPDDLALKQPTADAQAVAGALLQALQQGQAVVPVSDGHYFQGERALRQAFFARDSGVGLQFGLLSHTAPSGR